MADVQKCKGVGNIAGNESLETGSLFYSNVHTNFI